MATPPFLSETVAILDGTTSTDTEIEPLAPCHPDNPDQPAPFGFITENVYISPALHVSKERKRAKRMVCDCQFDPEVDEPEDACGEVCLNRVLMIECGSRCPCGEYCTNKRFQRAEYADVSVFKTEKKGWGLKANKEIPCGEFVMEYCGEVCTLADFEQRKVDYIKKKRRHYYFMSLRTDEILDATRKGNYSRFINHSCDPNCETQKWTVSGRLRIGFFSIKTVREGEELTFDYKFQRFGDKAQKCHCGSDNCRGYIGQSKQNSNSLKVVSPSPRELGSPRSPREKRRGRVQRLLSDADSAFEKEVYTIVGSSWRLKDSVQVLSLSRIMLQAETTSQRGMLLQVLLATRDSGCLKKFLSLQGLKLLWSWMIDSGDQDTDDVISFRIQMLRVLDHLPLTTKNQLEENKLLPIVKKWREKPTKAKLPPSPKVSKQESRILLPRVPSSSPPEDNFEGTVVTEADSGLCGDDITEGLEVSEDLVELSTEKMEDSSEAEARYLTSDHSQDEKEGELEREMSSNDEEESTGPEMSPDFSRQDLPGDHSHDDEFGESAESGTEPLELHGEETFKQRVSQVVEAFPVSDYGIAMPVMGGEDMVQYTAGPKSELSEDDHFEGSTDEELGVLGSSLKESKVQRSSSSLPLPTAKELLLNPHSEPVNLKREISSEPHAEHTSSTEEMEKTDLLAQSKLPAQDCIEQELRELGDSTAKHCIDQHQLELETLTARDCVEQDSVEPDHFAAKDCVEQGPMELGDTTTKVTIEQEPIKVKDCVDSMELGPSLAKDGVEQGLMELGDSTTRDKIEQDSMELGYSSTQVHVSLNFEQSVNEGGELEKHEFTHCHVLKILEGKQNTTQDDLVGDQSIPLNEQLQGDDQGAVQKNVAALDVQGELGVEEHSLPGPDRLAEVEQKVSLQESELAVFSKVTGPEKLTYLEKISQEVNPEEYSQEAGLEGLLQKSHQERLSQNVVPEVLSQEADPHGLSQESDPKELLQKVVPEMLLQEADLEQLSQESDPERLLPQKKEVPEALSPKADPEGLFHEVEKLSERAGLNVSLRVESKGLLHETELEGLSQEAELKGLSQEEETKELMQLVPMSEVDKLMQSAESKGLLEVAESQKSEKLSLEAESEGLLLQKVDVKMISQEADSIGLSQEEELVGRDMLASLAGKLIEKWEGLKEVFRIPKRAPIIKTKDSGGDKEDSSNEGAATDGDGSEEGAEPPRKRVRSRVSSPEYTWSRRRRRSPLLHSRHSSHSHSTSRPRTCTTRRQSRFAPATPPQYQGYNSGYSSGASVQNTVIVQHPGHPGHSVYVQQQVFKDSCQTTIVPAPYLSTTNPSSQYVQVQQTPSVVVPPTQQGAGYTVPPTQQGVRLMVPPTQQGVRIMPPQTQQTPGQQAPLLTQPQQTAMYSGQHTALLPGPQTSIMLGQQTSMLPGQQTSMLPGQQISMLPGQQTSMLPGQQTSMLPGQQTSLLPGHQTSMLPGQQTSMLPGPQMSMLSGQQTSTLTGQQTSMLPGQQTSLLPNQQMSMLPGPQMSILPGQQTSTSMLPGQQTSMLPGQHTSTLPGQQASVLPGQQVMPGQQMSMLAQTHQGSHYQSTHGPATGSTRQVLSMQQDHSVYSTAQHPTMLTQQTGLSQPQQYVGHHTAGLVGTSLQGGGLLNLPQYVQYTNSNQVYVSNPSMTTQPKPLLQIKVSSASAASALALPPLPPPPPAENTLNLPLNWKAATDPNGKVYYYHVITRKTQWERPTEKDVEGTITMDLGTPEPESGGSDHEQAAEVKGPRTPTTDYQPRTPDETPPLSQLDSTMGAHTPDTSPQPHTPASSTPGTPTDSLPHTPASSQRHTFTSPQPHTPTSQPPTPTSPGFHTSTSPQPHTPTCPQPPTPTSSHVPSGNELDLTFASEAEANLSTQESQSSPRWSQSEGTEDIVSTAPVIISSPAGSSPLLTQSPQSPSAEPVGKRHSSHRKHRKSRMKDQQSLKEAFRHKVTKLVTHCLDQHRKPDCKYGRITCVEDFKHLARKLSHGLTEKEIARKGGVDNVELTDSVRTKAKEYIRQYMKKFGSVYVRHRSPL